MKKIILWLSVIALAFVAGYLLVRYMSCPINQMAVYLSFFLISALACVFLVVTGFRGKWLALVIILVAVFFIGGYATMTQIILNTVDNRAVPTLTRSPSDPGDGHTAVVYFTHGEPENYNPIGWINQFNEFDEQKISFIPFLVRPIFFYQLRDHYVKVGQSNHRQGHKNMIKSLEEAYRADGDQTTKFYLSFLDDEPRPDAAVIQALNEGASKIIVSEVFLTNSNHTAEGVKQIKELELDKYQVEIVYVQPLWNSETLRSMFVSRVNANRGDTPKDKIAVLLVGHGQPDEWDVEWPTETEQETSFREEIIKLFEADGYLPENLSQAWMDFKEPKPKEKVEQLINQGVKKIFFFASAISADSMHSQYDIPTLVHEANIPAGVEVINLGAWGDDPIVIRAIKERIEASPSAE